MSKTNKHVETDFGLKYVGLAAVTLRYLSAVLSQNSEIIHF